MKKLFGTAKSPDQVARDAIRQKKWSKALEYYQHRAATQERDYALWNLIGDLHMSNKSRAQAVEAWRRALEGYVMEGLHENVLGIARKVLRRAPEEEDVYLLLADAYLGLEYHADCLAQIRGYVKLAKQKSEQDLRTSFKKLLEADIRNPHLLEELRSLYADSGIDDFELQQSVSRYVESRYTVRETPSVVNDDRAERSVEFVAPAAPAAPPDFAGGLSTLGDAPFSGAGQDFSGTDGDYLIPSGERGLSYAELATDETDSLPAGDGKDHYDLGIVYREMKLWDAAISEFEQARRDSLIRLRASLALAECMQESGDLPGALALLESEKQQTGGSPGERMGLDFQLGVIHELVGNLDQALAQFELVRSQNAAHEEAGQKVSELSRRLGRL